MGIHHPFYRRIQWNPLVAALPFAYLWHATYLRGFSITRTAGVTVATLWLGLAIFDAVTGHRLLDALYTSKADAGDEDERGV